eukprot:1600494-Pleurochrysis_carterae.AAC.1
MVVTSAPRARSSPASVDDARASPENTTSTLALPPGSRCRGWPSLPVSSASVMSAPSILGATGPSRPARVPSSP